MHVALRLVTLHLGEGESLKDKRHVIRGLIEKIGRRPGVAIAEVEDQDRLRMATLGIAVVSSSPDHAASVVSSVLAELDAEGFLEVIVVALDEVNI